MGKPIGMHQFCFLRKNPFTHELTRKVQCQTAGNGDVKQCFHIQTVSAYCIILPPNPPKYNRPVHRPIRNPVESDKRSQRR